MSPALWKKIGFQALYCNESSGLTDVWPVGREDTPSVSNTWKIIADFVSRMFLFYMDDVTHYSEMT